MPPEGSPRGDPPEPRALNPIPGEGAHLGGRGGGAGGLGALGGGLQQQEGAGGWWGRTALWPTLWREGGRTGLHSRRAGGRCCRTCDRGQRAWGPQTPRSSSAGGRVGARDRRERGCQAWRGSRSWGQPSAGMMSMLRGAGQLVPAGDGPAACRAGQREHGGQGRGDGKDDGYIQAKGWEMGQGDRPCRGMQRDQREGALGRAVRSSQAMV